MNHKRSSPYFLKFQDFNITSSLSFYSKMIWYLYANKWALALHSSSFISKYWINLTKLSLAHQRDKWLPLIIDIRKAWEFGVKNFIGRVCNSGNYSKYGLSSRVIRSCPLLVIAARKEMLGRFILISFANRLLSCHQNRWRRSFSWKIWDTR